MPAEFPIGAGETAPRSWVRRRKRRSRSAPAGADGREPVWTSHDRSVLSRVVEPHPLWLGAAVMSGAPQHVSALLALGRGLRP
jgi:hypothetical protein